MRLNFFAVAISACLIAALPDFAGAQLNEEFADMAQQVEAARTLARTDRKRLIMREARLTSAEAEAFWPIYEQYSDDIAKANDQRIKLITDYAANYEDLSDDMADEMIKDLFGYQSSLTKVRKSYVRKFKKVLPATKVARFYQLENKLDALIAFNLAAKIPLVPVDESKPMVAP